MGTVYFNPGCALSLYKPQMEERLLEILRKKHREIALHKICCRHDPQLEDGSTIINVCAGCDRRFSTLYPGISTISLWEVLDKTDLFPFPDYGGAAMSIHDPCPVRGKPQVHAAVRSLLQKMNVKVIEPALSGTRSVCCGDSFYGALPIEQIHERMKARAGTMPCEEVVVYCVSCIKSMHIGGKKPRHLLDLLLEEPTTPEVYETVPWHEQLEAYIETH